MRVVRGSTGLEQEGEERGRPVAPGFVEGVTLQYTVLCIFGTDELTCDTEPQFVRSGGLSAENLS